MSKCNSFCHYCTGNCIPEIHGCNDVYCPFHKFRFADIDNEDSKEIAVKLCGVKDEEE